MKEEVVLDIKGELRSLINQLLNEEIRPKLHEICEEEYQKVVRSSNAVCENISNTTPTGLKTLAGIPVKSPILILGCEFRRTAQFVHILRGQGYETIDLFAVSDYDKPAIFKRCFDQKEGTLIVFPDIGNDMSATINMAKQHGMPVLHIEHLFELDRVPSITICGSYKFINEMEIRASEFRNQGFIVNVPRKLDVPVGDVISDSTARTMHLRKIDNSDIVFIVNPGGYIGESTLHEIEYAIMTGKPVYYMEQPSLYGVGNSFIGADKVSYNLLHDKGDI